MPDGSENRAGPRILVTGASGFIGRHLVAALRAAGHEVVGAARNPAAARRLIPDIEWRRVDFNRALTPADWVPTLTGIGAVVNCAGVLQSSRGNDIRRVHALAPIALFQAAEAAGIRRVVQVSALGADAAAGTAYAASKQRADDFLAASALDWVVLRPSLVYARDSYGGTALLRALAALPWIVPLPGDGRQAFQPIHMADLAAIVAGLLAPDAPNRTRLVAAGPEPLSLRQLLAGYRRWLGLGEARFLPVPMALVRLLARLADGLRWIGGTGALCSTAVAQLEYGNVAVAEPRIAAMGIRPRRFADVLAAERAGVAERWHARLYFLRPALRWSLGLFWLWTGLATAFLFPRAGSEALMAEAGIPTPLFGATLWLGFAFDIAIGVALLLRWRVRPAAALAISASIAYLALLSLTMGALWLHPLGALGKLVPLIVAMAVMAAIEDDR
jgi:uncharacterized protein YbjT (DUF2867 family)